MAINRNLKTEGIVLSENRYKDSSKFLNVLTKDFGKITINAKGAMRPKSKILSSSQTLAQSKFVLSKYNDTFYIIDSSYIRGYNMYSNNIEKLVTALYFSELVDKSLMQNEPNEFIYTFLESAMLKLKETDANIRIFKLAFDLKYISYLGYRPILERCVDCGKKPTENMFFSVEDGGLICNNCLIFHDNYVKLSIENINLLNLLLYTKFSDLNEIPNTENTELIKLDKIINSFIMYNISVDSLNSYKKLMEIYSL
ncbi:MAG: DNA repair protein RecO [Tissierellia bacterium]|nr:DNA repair protein RecO [Tissierellia bacterium]